MVSPMASAAKPASPAGFFLNLNSPLDGVNGTIAFGSLAIIGAFVYFLLGSKFLALEVSTKIGVVQVVIVLLGACWVAYSISNSVGSFLVYGAALIFFCLPVAGMIWTGSSVLFWLSLILMVALAVLSVFSTVETSEPWAQLLIALYAMWIVAGVVVTLGSPTFLGYAESSAALSEFHLLLDARYLITFLMLLAAFGDSMFRAFAAGVPTLPPAPQLRSVPIENLPESGFAMLVRPVFVFVNLFILICQALVNLIWQLVGLVVVYLYRTARNLAYHFYALVTDAAIVKAIGRVVLSFTSGLLMLFVIDAAVADIVLYITSLTSPFALTAAIIWAMMEILVFAILFTGFVLLFAWMWSPENKSNKQILDQAASGGSMLLLSLALSAGAIHALAKIGLIDMVGFESVGILMWIFILLLGCVFAFHLALLMTAGLKHT